MASGAQRRARKRERSALAEDVQRMRALMDRAEREGSTPTVPLPNSWHGFSVPFNDGRLGTLERGLLAEGSARRKRKAERMAPRSRTDKRAACAYR